MSFVNDVLGWLAVIASIYLVGAVIVSAVSKPGGGKSGGIDT